VDEVMSTELHLLLELEKLGCVTTLQAVMCLEIKGLVSETRLSEHINVLIHVQLDGLSILPCNQQNCIHFLHLPRHFCSC